MTTTEFPREGLKANVSSPTTVSPENLGNGKTLPGLYPRWGPLGAVVAGAVGVELGAALSPRATDVRQNSSEIIEIDKCWTMVVALQGRGL